MEVCYPSFSKNQLINFPFTGDICSQCFRETVLAKKITSFNAVQPTQSSIRLKPMCKRQCRNFQRQLLKEKKD